MNITKMNQLCRASGSLLATKPFQSCTRKLAQAYDIDSHLINHDRYVIYKGDLFINYPVLCSRPINITFPSIKCDGSGTEAYFPLLSNGGYSFGEKILIPSSCPTGPAIDTSCAGDLMTMNNLGDHYFAVTRSPLGASYGIHICFRDVQEDIDECSEGAHDCDVNATCHSTDGSYKCACNTGYTGVGGSCSDIDECSGCSHNCHANSACNNTDGSYMCACNTGYTGTGRACSDIDECQDGGNTCHSNAACYSTDGSYRCACNTGYTGTGRTCSEITCPKVSAPSNGSVTVGSISVGATREYECHPGYSLSGSTTVRCTPNGIWFPAQPSCQVTTKITSNNPIVAIAPGSTASLSCHFLGINEKDIIWLLPNNTWIDANNTNYYTIEHTRINATTILSSLQFQLRERNPVGEYTCFGSNSRGNQSFIITVARGGAPNTGSSVKVNNAIPIGASMGGIAVVALVVFLAVRHNQKIKTVTVQVVSRIRHVDGGLLMRNKNNTTADTTGKILRAQPTADEEICTEMILPTESSMSVIISR